jgi:DNA-binding phage protein
LRKGKNLKGGKKMFDKRKLQAQMVLKGKTVDDVAKEIGLNPATFYRKMNRDGDFSRKEIQNIIIALEISDPMDIFFTEEFA